MVIKFQSCAPFFHLTRVCRVDPLRRAIQLPHRRYSSENVQYYWTYALITMHQLQYNPIRF